MPIPAAIPIALGIGSILSSLFGSLFGARTQANTARETTRAQIEANNRAAELERQSFTDALEYTRGIDARDYRDWLAREARDRTDWEASEQRRAPYRALGDSATRTLADYIRVPGMRPAQEVPVQRWTAQAPTGPQAGGGPLASTTMPVGGPRWTVLPQDDPGLLDQFGRRPRRTLADYARG